MKRALVTGATGFVGANLARRLLRDGHDVHLLVRPEHAAWRIDAIHDDVHLHTVDLDDAEKLAAVVRTIRPEWLFHLAAYGAYASQDNLPRMIRTNLNGTVNLVEACLQTGFEGFINTGSSSEYGLKDHPPAETEWIDPNSHYALTKAAATHYCRYTAVNKHAPIVTLRLYSVYGPYEEPTRLIPNLILNGLQDRLPPLVDQNIARDYIYVDDVNDAYLQAVSAADRLSGAVYNVGTGIQTTLGEIVAVTRESLKVSSEPQWGSMPNRRWDTNVWVANSAAIRETLGWEAKHTIAQGLQRTIQWFRDNPALEQFYLQQLSLKARSIL